jgi:hypothetical protein
MAFTRLDLDRNAIERMSGRFKDFRRIATRDDRLARNDLAAVCLAATVGNDYEPGGQNHVPAFRNRYV